MGEVDSEYTLKFELTERQKQISSRLTQLVLDGKSVLLEAVCGAGKTEIVFSTIAAMLSQGKTVGFAIARRQVVLEIAERRGVSMTEVSLAWLQPSLALLHH